MSLDRLEFIAWATTEAADFRRASDGGYRADFDAQAQRFEAIARMLKAQSRAESRLVELLEGDGFAQADRDEWAYCPMCGRTRSDGHRESCARYVLADVLKILKGTEVIQ